ncbi:hypothetical protein PROFUN_05256 [Planoprotostelium fungivorum]|uniref:Uncharacterized protein n=1 Tax=Planoprotostelium fungivorum TaxID=1890364 RepID=A0A2P6NR87_9EUKA|nr:hypothetical protein PROFUN_05256 [Planoprotostelium fungivorum]
MELFRDTAVILDTNTLDRMSPTEEYPKEGASIFNEDLKWFISGGVTKDGQMTNRTFFCAGDRDSWQVVKTSNDPPASAYRTATVLDDVVYLLGGHTKDVTPQNVFSLNLNKPETLSWSKKKSFAGEKFTIRKYHSATAYKRNIFIFGGLDEAGKPLNDLWTFDTGFNKWENQSQKGKVPSRRYGHSTICFGDHLYLFGGTDGKIYFDDLYRLDMKTLQWHPLNCPNGPSARAFHGCTQMYSKMMVHGGRGEQGIVSDLKSFDTNTNQWTTVNTASVSRENHSLFFFNRDPSIIHVIGGGAGFSQARDHLDIPATGPVRKNSIGRSKTEESQHQPRQAIVRSQSLIERPTTEPKSILKKPIEAPTSPRRVDFSPKLAYFDPHDTDHLPEPPEPFVRVIPPDEEDEPIDERFTKKPQKKVSDDGNDYEALYLDKKNEVESLSDRIEGLCEIIDESMTELEELRAKLADAESKGYVSNAEKAHHDVHDDKEENNGPTNSIEELEAAVVNLQLRVKRYRDKNRAKRERIKGLKTRLRAEREERKSLAEKLKKKKQTT